MRAHPFYAIIPIIAISVLMLNPLDLHSGFTGDRL